MPATKYTIIIIVSLVFSGCAITQKAQHGAPIQNVAIISAIGSEVIIQHFGVFAISEEYRQPVDWKLGEAAARAAAEALKSKNPSISVVPVDYDSDDLAKSVNLIASFQSYADPKRIESKLRRSVEGKNLDAVILITKDRQAGGTMPYSDIGIGNMLISRDPAPVTPFAIMRIFLLDAETMQVLATAGLSNTGKLYNYNPLVSSQPLGGPAPFRAYFRPPFTDEQAAFLRPILTDLVADAARRLVERMEF